MLEEILLKIQGFALWIGIAFVLVIVAMVLDLFTGIAKAKRKGELTTSSGLRKTCSKAAKYFIPILACACFDLLLSSLPIYDIPFLSIFFAAFCILIEVKSVFENTRTRNENMEMAKLISDMISKKDDASELLAMVLKNVISDDGNPVTKDKVIECVNE